MKKTTWLTLAMFFVSPIILIALAQVCIKNKSNVVNLTQSKLLRLQPVEAVVLNADSALLDSAGIFLRLTITTRDTAVGNCISYYPEILQATQRGGLLTLSLSANGRKLIQEGHRLLENIDLSRVNPDTLYGNDTLNIYLHAGSTLSQVVVGTNQILTFNEAHLPRLRLKTLGDVSITNCSSIGHLQMNTTAFIEVDSSDINLFDLHLANSEIYNTASINSESAHISTLRLTGAGQIGINNGDYIDHILLEPTSKKAGGIDITYYSVKRRRSLK